MKTAIEMLINEDRKKYSTQNTQELPTVKLVHSSHSVYSTSEKLRARLSRDGIKLHQRAPDYLLAAAGLPRSIHTAWSTRSAISRIQD